MLGNEDLGLRQGKLINPNYLPSFDELSAEFADHEVPLLDQQSVNVKGLTEDQRHWREHGYVIKKKFLSDAAVDRFLTLRKRLDLGLAAFPSAAPFLDHPEIRDICCSRGLHYLLSDLIGEEVGLHFNLSNFTSTERGWHQDDYLNPPDIKGRYCAVWMAMGDIDPDSGPFQYIPGSHKWAAIRGDLVKKHIVEDSRSDAEMLWPLYAEYFVNKAIEQKARDTASEVKSFHAEKGDILIWHAKLAHRGSIPRIENLERPALIAHYSTVRSRRDFSIDISRHGDGGYFWDFGVPLDASAVRPIPATA